MIEATETALQAAGLPKVRIHSERFASENTPKSIAVYADFMPANESKSFKFSFEIMLDGKSHSMGMNDVDNVLDVALAEGLDLPYACKGGVLTCQSTKVIVSFDGR